MKTYRVLCLLLLCLLSSAAHADTTITTVGSTVTPADNCGFSVGGSTDGWIRMHLYNDSGSTRDLWVRAGQFYPLRLKDVLLPNDATHPTSLIVDTDQSCGYTRSTGADECGNYSFDLPTNVGFYAGETPGSSSDEIDVKFRPFDTSGSAWRTYDLTAGEFVLGDVADCNLVTGSNLGYLTLISQ